MTRADLEKTDRIVKSKFYNFAKEKEIIFDNAIDGTYKEVEKFIRDNLRPICLEGITVEDLKNMSVKQFILSIMRKMIPAFEGASKTFYESVGVKNYASLNTIYIKNYSDTLIQCTPNRSRSLLDVYRLCKYYYNSTLKEVKNILHDLTFKYFILYHQECSTVHRTVYYIYNTRHNNFDIQNAIKLFLSGKSQNEKLIGVDDDDYAEELISQSGEEELKCEIITD